MEIRHINDINEKKQSLKILEAIYGDPHRRIPNYDAYSIKICKYAEFICVYNGSEIVGFVAFYANDTGSGSGYITQIDVSPICRGMGIGTSLIGAAEDYCRNSGMKIMRLEVRRDNAGAIAFYKKHGYVFEKNMTDKSYYMRKNL